VCRYDEDLIHFDSGIDADVNQRKKLLQNPLSQSKSFGDQTFKNSLRKVVGLYKLTHSLDVPGFNPRAYDVTHSLKAPGFKPRT
jgi:hypothetical protein